MYRFLDFCTFIFCNSYKYSYINKTLFFSAYCLVVYCCKKSLVDSKFVLKALVTLSCCFIDNSCHQVEILLPYKIIKFEGC